MKKLTIFFMTLGTISSYASSLENDFKNIQSRIPEMAVVKYDSIQVLNDQEEYQIEEERTMQSSHGEVTFKIDTAVRCVSKISEREAFQASRTKSIKFLQTNTATAISNQLFICK